MKSIFVLPRRYLDTTPMYRVVFHTLLVIYVCALASSMLGWIGFGTLEILALSGVVTVSSLLASYACAFVTQVPAQHISSLITALLLTLLLMPSIELFDLYSAGVITLLAIASKYVLVYKKQHIINPVVAGLVIGNWLGFGGASWWVSNPTLFLPIVIGGLFVLAKVRRFDMVAVFLSVSYIVYMMQFWLTAESSFDLLKTFWMSYPVLFLGMFMLTEPFTMPSQRIPRLLYAGAVALLISVPAVGAWSISPEMALLIGNVAFAPWSLRQKLMLSLCSVRELTPRIFEFTFTKPAHFTFEAGQYLEWMLPHKKSDSRSIRRYFTIVSAPAASHLKVSMKIPVSASSFKKAIFHLPLGSMVTASQLAGDFVLPKNTAVKLGFIAGGIGVTPFVSQVEQLVIDGEERDIVTLYCAQTANDLAYGDVLATAGPVVPVLGAGPVPTGGELGFLSAEIVTRRVPDYANRTWYVSGPPVMVDNTYRVLRDLGVPARHIKRDFFPGLA